MEINGKKRTDIIAGLFSGLAIDTHQILFLHVRLRHIQAQTGKSYGEITKEIIHHLLRFEPEALIVPAYTFSFRKSGVFHRLFSRSEVGKFSEEVRLHHARYRTPDPMYSMMDLTGYVQSLTDIDYSKTFGNGSLFHHLNQKGYLIINIDLDEFLSTEQHDIEKQHQVGYRHVMQYQGVIYHDNRRWEPITYTTFLRKLKGGIAYPPYNEFRKKQYLIEKGLLNTITYHGVELAWIQAHVYLTAIHEALSLDRNFLITSQM